MHRKKVNHGYGREIYDNWDDYGPDTRHIGGPVSEEEMDLKNYIIQRKILEFISDYLKKHKTTDPFINIL